MNQEILEQRNKMIKGKLCSKCGISLEGDKFHGKEWGCKCHNCFKEMMNNAARNKKNKIKSDILSYVKYKSRLWKATAKQRGRIYHLSPEYLLEVFNKQQGKCLFTGVVLQSDDEDNFSTYLSIDRIDSDVGYIEGNIAFVSRGFNNQYKKNLPLSFIRDYIPKMYGIIEDFRNGIIGNYLDINIEQSRKDKIIKKLEAFESEIFSPAGISLYEAYELGQIYNDKGEQHKAFTKTMSDI